MSYNHLLSRTDNRLEDFEANARGELTQRQRDRLRRIVVPLKPKLTPQEKEAAKKSNLGPSNDPRIAALFGTAFLIMVIWQTSPALACVVGALLVGCVVWITRISTAEVKHISDEVHRKNSRYHSTLNSPHIRTQILRQQGPLVMKQGVGNVIEVGSQPFEVTRDLWLTLNDLDGDVIAYFLRSAQHGDLLLSIQPTMVIDQERYHQVIGVSDDGEIIYQQDLEDNIPDGEVRPLKKSDLSDA